VTDCLLNNNIFTRSWRNRQALFFDLTECNHGAVLKSGAGQGGNDPMDGKILSDIRDMARDELRGGSEESRGPWSYFSG
jgi:hypothetical protein